MDPNLNNNKPQENGLFIKLNFTSNSWKLPKMSSTTLDIEGKRKFSSKCHNSLKQEPQTNVGPIIKKYKNYTKPSMISLFFTTEKLCLETPKRLKSIQTLSWSEVSKNQKKPPLWLIRKTSAKLKSKRPIW
jgi:hypothetical protein